MSVKKKIVWGIIILVIVIIALIVFNPTLSSAFMEGYNEAREH